MDLIERSTNRFHFLSSFQVWSTSIDLDLKFVLCSFFDSPFYSPMLLVCITSGDRVRCSIEREKEGEADLYRRSGGEVLIIIILALWMRAPLRVFLAVRHYI